MYILWHLSQIKCPKTSTTLTFTLRVGLKFTAPHLRFPVRWVVVKRMGLQQMRYCKLTVRWTATLCLWTRNISYHHFTLYQELILACWQSTTTKRVGAVFGAVVRAPMWPKFDSTSDTIMYSMWVDFGGSLLGSERFCFSHWLKTHFSLIVIPKVSRAMYSAEYLEIKAIIFYKIYTSNFFTSFFHT